MDGKARGKLDQALFPAGLRPGVQPVGQRQVDRASALLTRGQERGLSSHETLGAIFSDLGAARDKLQADVTARKEAYATVAGAHAAETMAREDFCSAYSRQVGLVRSQYPKSPPCESRVPKTRSLFGRRIPAFFDGTRGRGHARTEQDPALCLLQPCAAGPRSGLLPPVTLRP